MKRDIAKAAGLYKRFREEEPKRARSVKITLPKAMMVMGTLDAVLYTTTHGGRSQSYKHTFNKGSRPLLCAGTKDGQLFVVGGRFRVTARGIVDLNGRRREIG